VDLSDLTSETQADDDGDELLQIDSTRLDHHHHACVACAVAMTMSLSQAQQVQSWAVACTVQLLCVMTVSAAEYVHEGLQTYEQLWMKRRKKMNCLIVIVMSATWMNVLHLPLLAVSWVTLTAAYV
jgi:hypothetical protein